MGIAFSSLNTGTIIDINFKSFLISIPPIY